MATFETKRFVRVEPTDKQLLAHFKIDNNCKTYSQAISLAIEQAKKCTVQHGSDAQKQSS